MREIKFRAWNPKLKQMKQVDYINLIAQFTGQFDDKIKMRKDLFGDETIVSLEGGFLWKFDDGIEIMQYTGLKDKNGKEIYEGDILALKTHLGNVVFGFVVFKYGAFCLSSRETYYDDELISNLGVEFEVIGNIYENPELLEQGK